MSPILKIPKSTKSLHPTADDATMKTRFTIQLSLGLGCGLHTVVGGWGRARVEEYTVLGTRVGNSLFCSKLLTLKSDRVSD